MSMPHPQPKARAYPALVTGIIVALLIAGALIAVTRHRGAQNAREHGTSAFFPAGTKSAPVQTPVAPETPPAPTHRAIIKTAKGDIAAELYGKDAPMTVANFVKLARRGFYRNLTFHRVEPDFVIQGGDPRGDGNGGPGYTIKLEISPKLRHLEGALAMARTQDPDSAGSQFYITLAESRNTEALDGQYAVFGKVITGMDVARKIAVGDRIKDITISEVAQQ